MFSSSPAKKIWQEYLIGQIDVSEEISWYKNWQKAQERYTLYTQFIHGNDYDRKFAPTKEDNDHPASKALYNMSKDPLASSKLVFYLLLEGANPSFSDNSHKKETTAIHNFAKNHNYKALTILQKAKLLNCTLLDDHHRTPLILACLSTVLPSSSSSRRKTISLLLTATKHPTVINQKDHDECTAIYYCIVQKSIACVLLLLTHDATLLPILPDLVGLYPSLRLLYITLYPTPAAEASRTLHIDCLRRSMDPALLQYHQATLDKLPQDEMYDYTTLFTTTTTTSSISSAASSTLSSSMLLPTVLWVKERLHGGRQLILEKMIKFRLREELRQWKGSAASFSSLSYSTSSLIANKKIIVQLKEDDKKAELPTRNKPVSNSSSSKVDAGLVNQQQQQQQPTQQPTRRDNKESSKVKDSKGESKVDEGSEKEDGKQQLLRPEQEGDEQKQDDNDHHITVEEYEDDEDEGLDDGIQTVLPPLDHLQDGYNNDPAYMQQRYALDLHWRERGRKMKKETTSELLKRKKQQKEEESWRSQQAKMLVRLDEQYSTSLKPKANKSINKI